MESLLHWDFAPRLALADQVRRKFGSTVHFSPSRDRKEFFLVVMFSSASFPLNVDSVGIALQCCIGGISSGFKVIQINSRAFRFSVANNKVGHFIYGLKDQVWPDFVCHFHLFNGLFTRAPISSGIWHADTELPEISTRRPMAISSKLGFFTQDTLSSDSSQQELSKFSLVPLSHMDFSDSNAAEASSSSMIHTVNSDSLIKDHAQIKFGEIVASINDRPTIMAPSRHRPLMDIYLRQAELEDNVIPEYLSLGDFQCPINVPYPNNPQCFLASAFKYAPAHSVWLPTLSARHKADLAQACYSQEEIDTLTKNWASLCSRCLQWGHQKIHCHARVICIHCSSPDQKVINYPSRPLSKPNDSIFNDHENAIIKTRFPAQMLPNADRLSRPRTTVRCLSCGQYGHPERSCYKRLFTQRWKWVLKLTQITKSTPHVLDSASISQTTPPKSTHSPSLPPLLCSAAMANYPLNPVPFLPPGFAVEPGPANRVVRSGMVVGPIPPSTTTTWR